MTRDRLRHEALRAEADREIDDAAEWYEKERAGLGVDFVRAVREALEQVSETPSLLPREPNSPSELNIKRKGDATLSG